MKKLSFILLLMGVSIALHAQQLNFNRAHSHNDYKQNIPFLQAYYAGAGSIEADVFYYDEQLFVAHEKAEIQSGRTLTQMYLKPLAALFAKNGNRPYADSGLNLQLVIDIKEDREHVIPQLLAEIQPFKNVFTDATNNHRVRLVLSGDMPPPAEFNNYPDFILFDGRPAIAYTADELKHVAMISDALPDYTEWNGKGTPTAADFAKLHGMVNKAHAQGKPFRFWATQDSPNTWIQLEKIGVDWINTDHPQMVHDFYVNRTKLEFVNKDAYAVYKPTYKTDGSNKKVKRVILLIGDGMGLTQIQAGLTANHGALNMLQCHYNGFSKTWAVNSDNTDSAAGATAMACGQKTNNRYIGVDADGKPLANLPDLLAKKDIKSGIISVGDITDATPAAFYAHNTERSNSAAIAADFAQSHVNVLIGSNYKRFYNSTKGNLEPALTSAGYVIDTTLAGLNKKGINKQAVLLNSFETRPVLQGRGNMLAQSLNHAINLLKTNKPGFFIMAEGAQIDHGGHANDLPFLVTELLDFDKTVGEALKFADEDGQTLVIITADHETGGLSLLDAQVKEGRVLGNFSTNDHTSVSVPVFAYGPHAQDFTGTYQNTAIFTKILTLLTQ